MASVIKHKSASVTLRPTTDNKVWVANLYSEERMKGHARELMQKVVDRADAQDMTLQLDARAYGTPYGMSTGALILFYESFGFQRIPEVTKHLMERQPIFFKGETDVTASVVSGS